MGKFNSDDYCIYYCGQESLRRNRVALIANKRIQNGVLGSNLKNDRMISLHFQGKPFNITIIQSMLQLLMLKKLKLNSFYEDLQDLLELTPKKKKKKDALFITGDWNAEVGSQAISEATDKFGLGIQNEVG